MLQIAAQTPLPRASGTLLFLRKRKHIPKLLFCCVVLGTSVGCGTPGIPLPPSLNLPKPVSDLRAARKSNRVQLSWTAPTQTTDRQVVRRRGSTRICRAETTMKECVIVAELKSARTDSQYIDNIPASAMTNAFGDFIYAVEVLNDHGHSGGLSNLASVPATPTLPPPNGLAVRVAADGVFLSWSALAVTPKISGLQFIYRIYRREKDARSETVAGEIALDPMQDSFVDHNFDWEKQYSYRVTPVTLLHRDGRPNAEVEGEDSSTLTIFTHDVFPPAAPTELQAAYSNGFIDLVWTPSSASDLAGYNLYRRESGSSAVKLNASLLRTPAFRDLKVSPGIIYFYSVSSVDVRGNESAHSVEASETIPKDFH